MVDLTAEILEASLKRDNKVSNVAIFDNNQIKDSKRKIYEMLVSLEIASLIVPPPQGLANAAAIDATTRGLKRKKFTLKL